MRIVSLNVQGRLTSGGALAALLTWLQSTGIHVCFLQEVRGAVNPQELLAQCPGAQATLGNRFRWFHSPGGAAGGCLTLVDPVASGLSDIFQHPDSTLGRCVRLDALLAGTPVTLVNVYAPATPADRSAFFSSSLSGLLPRDRPLLVGGDLNCVLDAEADIWYGNGIPTAHSTRTVGAQALATLSEELGLVDIWRRAHPLVRDARLVTHFSVSHPSGARLDRFLASPSLLALAPATSCDIGSSSGIRTDHYPVTLCVKAPSAAVPFGRSVPSFPLLLLNLPAAVSELEDLLHVWFDPLLQINDADELVTRWIGAKAAILQLSLGIYGHNRKAALRSVAVAEQASASAIALLAAAPPGSNVSTLLAAASAASRAVADAWGAHSAQSLLAADILDHLYGDSSSFYFHTQAKPPHPRTVIAALNRPGRLDSDPADTARLDSLRTVGAGLLHAQRFFSADSPCGLFRERPTDAAAQATLLAALPPRLPEYVALEGEGPARDGHITADELAWALRRARRGSSPGPDGLPYEFYHALKGVLLPVLMHVFNTAFASVGSSAPLARLLDGTICLLHKAGKPADELDGYRPLTLLNSDVKLAMLILSGRLQRPLEYVIDISQSAFLVGRDISDNVRYAQGLTARLQDLGLPAWMLQSDLTKAYDSVDRGWLVQVMRRMGLKEHGAVRWAQILLNGSTSRVRVNGFFCPAFPVRASLAQGSAVSCQEWLIVFQPLVSYLNSLAATGRLTSIELPSGTTAPASSDFADDSAIVVCGSSADPAAADAEAAVVRDAFAVFCGAAGPAQSCGKSSLVLLTCPAPLPAALDPAASAFAPCGYSLAPLGLPVRHLGVPVAAPPAACSHAAFDGMQGKMVAASLRWIPLRPNLLGRSHVALQCLASKAVYASAFVCPSPVTLSAMQGSVNRFVAASALPEEEVPFPDRLYPRFAVARLPVAQGGSGVPDLGVAFRAMQAKAVWVALGVASAHPWRDLFLGEVAAARLPGGLAPPGAAWLVALPAAGDPAAVRTPSFKASVDAFLSLGVQRIVQPDSQSPLSALRELTFGNAVSGSLSLAAVTTDEARSWLRLADVREACLGGILSAAAREDAIGIVARLPPSWQTAVTSPEHHVCDWVALSAPGDPDQVYAGPWPAQGPPPPPLFGNLWTLLPTGRLAPRCHPFVAAGPGRAALVVLRDKPQHAFDAADYAFCEDQRQTLPRSEWVEPQEPYLVGIWSSLEVDPGVWGVPVPGSDTSVSLLDLSVRTARAHLLDAAIRSSSDQVHGYAEHHAAYPAAWPRGTVLPDPAQLLIEGEDDELIHNAGLMGMQARWRTSAAAAVADSDADSDTLLDAAPAWLTPREAGVSRPGDADRDDRAARRASQPTAPVPTPVANAALRDGYAAAWQRLNDRSIHRPFRISAGRILHGCLGCRAFLAHVRGSGLPFCDLPCCQGHGRVEDLSHAFLDCPAAAPVITWLLGTWQALTGLAAPRDPWFLLADIPEAGWEGCGADPWLLRMWTRLRVATLGCMWRVRKLADSGPRAESFSRQAARMAVETVRASITRDWRRTSEDVRSMDRGVFCADWWRGLDVQLSVEDFKEFWAKAPVFCSVSGDALLLRLSVSGPLPLPA